MSETLAAVRALVARGEVRISDHGYDELADDGIFAGDVLAGVATAVVVEDYPDDPRVRLFWRSSATPTESPFMWSGPSRQAGAVRASL